MCRDRTHVPTCQKVTRCQLSYRGRYLPCSNTFIFVPASPDQGHDRPRRRGVRRVFLEGVRPDSPSRRRIPSCYRPGPGRGVVVELGQRGASQHPAVTKPCASLKKPRESCPFAAPCGPRRKKNDRGQRSAFPSETSRFALSILAHRGSALPWLVNDRAALRLRRIWCVPT